MIDSRATLAAAFFALLFACASLQAQATDPAGVEFFEKQVRPLLAARCQGCHGAEKQKGNLRLDSRAAALAGGDTGPALVPGKPEESLLVDAIRYGDTYQMPPKSQLPPQEIEILVQWVRLGAPWGQESADRAAGAGPFDLTARAKHWSFQSLAVSEPPTVANSAWVQTPVDRFILAGLEAAGLAPAAPADKYTLLRRVTFDLIGLPPTPAEIEAFLADESPDAYAQVVDRLLDSPHYGERWARHWLDLVRYSETHGHEFDYDMPNAYRYRDYVIRALNDDLPYDQFVVEHVAGDLLPHPRRHPQEGFNESILATGSFFFGEAKHSPVDVRQDQADRIDNQIDVFGKTFLALTVSCARCHDHKFDAISTKDYYALAGYLQSSRYQQAFIDPPQQFAGALAQLEQLARERQQASFDWAGSVLKPRLTGVAKSLIAGAEAGEPTWVKTLCQTALADPRDLLHVWASLTSTPDGGPDDFAARLQKQATRISAESAAAKAGDGAVVFADFSGSDYGSWITTGAAFGNRPARPSDWTFVGERNGASGRLVGARAAHSGLISSKLQGTLRSPTFTIDKPKIWYRVWGRGGQVRLVVDGLQLIQNPIYGGLKFDPGGPQPHWHEQDVSKWLGQRAYVELVDDGDGYLALEHVAFSDGPPPTSATNHLVAELLAAAPASSAVLAEKYQALFEQALSDWLAQPTRDDAGAADRAAVVNWVIDHLAGAEPATPSSSEFAARAAAFAQRQTEIEARLAAPRQAMALADGTAVNEHVFIRGNYKTPGPEVPRRFLEALGGTALEAPATGSGRLELAAQLVANPLVPRVLVNRLWHHHFGAGLVRTPDDFGVMGLPPTHPALLDYLASELMRRGWSLKSMHRLLVLSATYQMSTERNAEADGRDPQNKLWHRMPVRRLEAEAIRDAMLAVSGRADATMYGPGVMPYLTVSMTGRGRPGVSGPLDGDGRRSIYLAVRRNFLPPMFLAFDYPIPFTTIGRRSTSNVPAQALALLNNLLVIEQSRLWATRVLREPARANDRRVREMYLTAFGRPPDNGEQQAALEFLAATNGETGRTPGDAQAWADLAHVLLNVKEFIFLR